MTQLERLRMSVIEEAVLIISVLQFTYISTSWNPYAHLYTITIRKILILSLPLLTF